MHRFNIPLTTSQTIAHLNFKKLIQRKETTAEELIGFLRSITDKNLLIKNLEFLLQISEDNEQIRTYINQEEFEEHWLVLLDHIGILPQLNFSCFELLLGIDLYSRAKRIRDKSNPKYLELLKKAAIFYNSFHALKEFNDMNQVKLNKAMQKALQKEKVDEINCIAMYNRVEIAKRHGTPGYILIASVCFWIATYYKTVIENILSASPYYQLAVQNLYCAHIIKDECKASIKNARFSPNGKTPTPLNEYNFFYLLPAIETGKIESMIQTIQKKAGFRLLGNTEITLAKQAAISEATQFLTG